MGLSDLAGVFSRYFVVGFFLPAFFALIALSQTINAALLPAIYEQASRGAQVAVLGGAALPVGLTLLGLNYQLTRLYEGYPLAYQQERAILKRVYELLMWRQRHRFRRALAQSRLGSPQQQRVAEWRLDRRFPRRARGSGDESLLLPTSFGNAIRAFERHSYLRWCLDSIAIWPHVEMLLSDQENQILADAKSNVAFFINLSLLAVLTAVALAADMVGYASSPSGFFLLIPAAIAIASYRAAIGSTVNWGEVVRAAVDLHHREIYTKLGVRTPNNFADERQLAWHVGQTLLTGAPLPDDLAATRPSTNADHETIAQARRYPRWITILLSFVGLLSRHRSPRGSPVTQAGTIPRPD